jgi:ketosteroid isomerase-like protein
MSNISVNTEIRAERYRSRPAGHEAEDGRNQQSPRFPVNTSTPTQPPTRPVDVARRAAIESFFAAVQAGDTTGLHELLTADAVTRWPQSHERITGAGTCVLVHTNYPGGPPQHRVERITGSGDSWVAELTADYGADRWFIVSVIEFDGDRIARLTDYFGPTFPAPEWRANWVEIEDPDQAGAA